MKNEIAPYIQPMTKPVLTFCVRKFMWINYENLKEHCLIVEF